MKRITKALCTCALLVCTCAFAQTGGKANPADPAAQTTQPGKGSEEMGRATDAGTAKSASGTLMQKRANAMSPEGASGASATGKIKQ